MTGDWCSKKWQRRTPSRGSVSGGQLCDCKTLELTIFVQQIKLPCLHEEKATKNLKAHADLLDVCAKLKEELQSLTQANMKLENRKTEQATLGDKLKSHIHCHICFEWLWSPYVLDCGHAFCRSCLVSLFKTKAPSYIRKYPHLFSPSTTPYKCPECRAPVMKRPILDFTLKSLVWDMALTLDLKTVEPATPTGKDTEQPWEDFFGCY
ncbi:hypothetical protein V5O48_001841 [Marasmius crinis-equi]|uniref:RING-type domain-containing protein n=1 Tax=Marasmius crinis-equi TaxID=585013 RepID=A0ABR3FXF1_9AGAR